jgi:glycine oxidase
MNAECEYLVVGAGIAGFSIAYRLRQNDKVVILLNHELPGQATKVSSGLINPVTGQRMVLSWMYEEVKEAFLGFYKDLEDEYSCHLISERNLIQKLHSVEDHNLWLSKTADPLYQSYFGESLVSVPSKINASHECSHGLIKSAYLLAIDQLTSVIQKQVNINTKFDFTLLHRTPDRLIYDQIQIHKAIIFAEGFRISANPFFKWLPVIPLKGEGLIVNVPGLELNTVYKSGYTLIPLGEDLYWCGSNFEINATELSTSNMETGFQIDFLENTLDVPFEVQTSFFGIRLASKDRRPILGHHPQDTRLVVFNGLGTKGLSLAPYCSKQLVDYLLYGMDLPAPLSLERFISKGLRPDPI